MNIYILGCRSTYGTSTHGSADDDAVDFIVFSYIRLASNLWTKLYNDIIRSSSSPVVVAVHALSSSSPSSYSTATHVSSEILENFHRYNDIDFLCTMTASAMLVSIPMVHDVDRRRDDDAAAAIAFFRPSAAIYIHVNDSVIQQFCYSNVHDTYVRLCMYIMMLFINMICMFVCI